MLLQDSQYLTNALFWAPLCVAVLHIFEEFVFPGHFPEWYRKYKPELKASITPRFLVIINALLLMLCYDVGALRSTRSGTSLWLFTMSLLAANGIWHLHATLKGRSYSPGVVTGVFLYLPVAIYGVVFLEESGRLTSPSAEVAILIGGSYHIWSNLFHRSRAKTGTLLPPQIDKGKG